MSATDETIQRAVKAIRTASPGSRVILFGSYARGDAGPDSDLDFLVVEREMSRSQHEETVRLREAIGPIGVPVDVLVTTEAVYRKWSKNPGTIFYDAAREGRVFSDAA